MPQTKSQITGIRNSIDKVMDEQEEQNSAAAAAAAPANESDEDTGVGPAGHDAERPGSEGANAAKADRDADGKFKAKEKSDDVAAGDKDKAQKADKAAVPDKVSPTNAAPVSGEPVEGQPIAPPAAWSKEEKAQFASLTPAMQSTIARRETERDNALRKAQNDGAELKNRYATYEHVGTQHAQRLAAKGERPVDSFNRLLMIDQAFDNDPVGVLKELARQKNINLATLSQEGNATAADPFEDPLAKAARDDAAKLRQEWEADKQAKARAEYQNNERLVTNFADEKDAQGNLKRPFYAEVEAQVAEEIKKIRAAQPYLPAVECLQQAYETAVWADPRTRESMLALRTSTANASAASAEKAKADKAKAAAASVRGSSSGTPSRQPSGNKPDIRKLIDSAMSN